MPFNDFLDQASLPTHIGIIMDGNGRWAQKRKLPRSSGHKEGLNAAREIIKTAAKLGIKYLTLYTFSTENWKRTSDEVGFLMNLIKTHLRSEFEYYKKEHVRVTWIGDINGLPIDIQKDLRSIREESKSFSGLTLVFAINYGGRDEIIRAINKSKTMNENVTMENFSSFFDTPDLPDADLIIRTGGEKRISNFLMWHSAYSEFEFVDTLWPDYTPTEFNKSLLEFQNRTRRFGGL